MARRFPTAMVSEMPDIMVYKPFRLNMGEKAPIMFKAGLHVGVPRAQSEHWWTKLHASPVNTKTDIAVNKPSAKPAATAVVKMAPARRRKAG